MSKKVKAIIYVVVCLLLIGVAVFVWLQKQNEENTDTDSQKGISKVKKEKYPTLTFIGHATVKIKTSDGKVIYIDPYYQPGDYSDPADIILVTHEHSDHNYVQLCTKNKGCKEYRWMDMLNKGEYKTVNEDNIKIEAVPSGGNANHPVSTCVGYIVTVDGVSIFHAGDTSMDENKKLIAEKKIDYAMYPVDGQYNMGPDEAFEVAELVGATYNIPIHFGEEDISNEISQYTNMKGLLYIKQGDSIKLDLKQ